MNCTLKLNFMAIPYDIWTDANPALYTVKQNLALILWLPVDIYAL